MQQTSGQEGAKTTRESAAPRSGERGTELVLSASHDTEQLVCARGTLFLVTDRRGDIAPRGARELGLFFNDTRHLSYLSLNVENAELVHLSAESSHDAFNQVDLMVSGLDEGEFLDDPQNFLHVRRRQLLEDAFLEELTFTNFLGRAVDVAVRLEFDVDFADIFEVRGAKRPRRGTQRPPALSSNGVHYAQRHGLAARQRVGGQRHGQLRPHSVRDADLRGAGRGHGLLPKSPLAGAVLRHAA
jgi:glycogen debranching enzyme